MSVSRLRMAELPGGAVTFLFTDIDGSTQLVRRLGDDYAEVLAVHQELLRSAFAAREGHEIDTQGDAFMVVFGSARSAVAAAVDAQHRLLERRWPQDIRMRVRIGIHTGQAMPANGRYTGLAVHRAARICAAAHGGQIVVSQAARALLEDEEEALQINVVDLGEALLKDFDRPVRLYQVQAPGLETDFPPLRAQVAAVAVPGASAQVSGTFVGRRREVETLVAALDGAEAGRGRLITVSGEPGIGKTRLMAEFTAFAERRGVHVIAGRCYESEGAPPYWPWVQALRSHAERTQPDELRVALGTGAAVIADIVPEVRVRLPAIGPATASDDPKQARFRLFDSIVTLLRNSAAAHALVVVLDDFHAADSGSLLLLEFVANELVGRRLLVICSYRDTDVSRQHPLAKTLLELGRSQPVERLRLRGLSDDEAALLVEAQAGRDASVDLVATLHARSEGNPLFISELVHLLLEEGELDRLSQIDGHGRPLRIPEGVREVIGQRLDRLSEACNEALTIASVVGKGFRLEQLQPLMDELSGDQLLDALEEALGARLIEELADSAGHYQFSHALIRETLSGELSATRRLRLHARIAETLEQLYRGEIEAHAAELAYQFAKAESVLGTAKVLHYSRLAGEQAISGHAYEEALEHFERALAVKDGLALDAETAGLLFGLARAELGARELYEVGPALGRLVQAFEYYAGAGDVASALTVATHPVPAVWERTAFPDVVSRALALVDGDSIDAGRLLSTLGWFRSVHQRDHAGGERAFERALEIAREHGDQALERRTLVNAAHADYWQLAWMRCRERGLRAIALAADANDQRTEMAAREWPARVGGIVGDLADARLHAGAAVELAEKLRERHELANTCMYSSWLYSIAGNWTRARELSDRALALEPREPRNLSTRALLELQTGHSGEGERYLARLLDPARVTNWSLLEKFAMAAFLPMAGRILGTSERQELAKVTAEAALEATAMPPFMHLYGRIGLAFVAVEANDPALALAQYEAFESQRGTAIVMAGIAVDRLLGLLAAVQGQAEAARAHFEDALAFTSRAGYLPEVAWTASDHAEAIAAGVVPGDDATVLQLRAQALDVARSLGMNPLVARLERCLQAGVSGVRAHPEHPGRADS
jgi:class 3 adenylate cyclase/tetratricopeptide (TPR) repeat protein